MEARRPLRNPILPADTGDRTGSAGIRRRCAAETRRRFARIRRDLLAVFASVRIYGANQTADERTLYAATETDLGRIAGEIQFSIDQGLAPDVGGFRSWFDRYEEEAALLGAALAFANLSRLDPGYAATRTLPQITQSQAFQDSLAAARFASGEHMAGLASELRADVAQIVGRGIAAGTSPQLVRVQISMRVDALQAKALQYAHSRLASMVREMRMQEAEFAMSQGNRLALLWASAFRPTTRPHHAARHGSTYTPAEVRTFYATGANRFNCYCSTTEVLVDDAGRPILTPTLKQSMAKEKADWQANATTAAA